VSAGVSLSLSKADALARMGVEGRALRPFALGGEPRYIRAMVRVLTTTTTY
jgi:hypothetical protein